MVGSGGGREMRVAARCAIEMGGGIRARQYRRREKALARLDSGVARGSRHAHGSRSSAFARVETLPAVAAHVVRRSPVSRRSLRSRLARLALTARASGGASRCSAPPARCAPHSLLPVVRCGVCSRARLTGRSTPRSHPRPHFVRPRTARSHGPRRRSRLAAYIASLAETASPFLAAAEVVYRALSAVRGTAAPGTTVPPARPSTRGQTHLPRHRDPSSMHTSAHGGRR